MISPNGSLRALATDYDGTLATDARVSDDTLTALHRWKDTGRRLLLVTGRQLPDIRSIFPHFEIFDRIVAEDGGVLWEPALQRVRLLAPAPPPTLLDALHRHDVFPIGAGHVIIDTNRSQEAHIRAAIADAGIERSLSYNRNSLMLLPPGVNKAFGLAAAAEELALAPEQIAGIGDGENDIPFLGACGLGVAVGNAVPALRAVADRVMQKSQGDGVAELIDVLLGHAPEEAPGDLTF